MKYDLHKIAYNNLLKISLSQEKTIVKFRFSMLSKSLLSNIAILTFFTIVLKLLLESEEKGFLFYILLFFFVLFFGFLMTSFVMKMTNFIAADNEKIVYRYNFRKKIIFINSSLRIKSTIAHEKSIHYIDSCRHIFYFSILEIILNHEGKKLTLLRIPVNKKKQSETNALVKEIANSILFKIKSSLAAEHNS